MELKGLAPWSQYSPLNSAMRYKKKNWHLHKQFHVEDYILWPQVLLIFTYYGIT